MYWLIKHNRDAFSGFDSNAVAQMGEKEITETASNKALMLAESRVRCIVDNAKCMQKASQFQKHLGVRLFVFLFIAE